MADKNKPDSYRASPPVTTTSARRALEFDVRPDKIWLNPISMSQLKSAVMKKKNQVVLNGRLYDITYNQNWTSKITGEVREGIKLKRADGGFAPIGYVSIQRIMRFDFEENDD